MSAIGAAPNANGATITGTTLNLQPASASFGGIVTNGTQSIAGAKTFTSNVTAPDFIGTSDKRLKENIEILDINKINTIYKSFNMIGNKQERIGVIAQDLELHHPEFIRTDNEGYKSVSYIDLHSAEIAYLKDKIERLEELVNKLIK